MSRSFLLFCIVVSAIVMMMSFSHSQIIDWGDGNGGTGGSSYYRGYGYGSGGYGGGGGFHK